MGERDGFVDAEGFPRSAVIPTASQSVGGSGAHSRILDNDKSRAEESELTV